MFGSRGYYSIVVGPVRYFSWMDEDYLQLYIWSA